MAKRQKKLTKGQRLLRELKYLLLAVFIVICVLLISLVPFYSVRRMPGYAMMPTYMNNEILILRRWTEVRRFDVVCYRDPVKNTVMVGRIIGIQGDSLFYKNDQLILNGQGQTERYLNQSKKNISADNLTEDFTLSSVTGVDQVPKDRYFILADNRKYGVDSREYGLIEEESIIGKIKN